MSGKLKAEDCVLIQIKPNSYAFISKKVPEVGTFYISKGQDKNGNDYIIDTDIDLSKPGSQGYIEISYWLAEKIGL